MISELKEDLLGAKKLSAAALGEEIRQIGFACFGCGECCQGEDNSVLVFPREIRSIQKASGLCWLEVAAPPQEGEWDQEGSFHTLEWRLVKNGESCRFYQKSGCSIYSVRPLLCRTYPFYLDRGILMHSECRGLGRDISASEAERLAEQLILRHVTEIEEAIALLERYRDFQRGRPGGGGTIVHDSEGEHEVETGNDEHKALLK